MVSRASLTIRPNTLRRARDGDRRARDMMMLRAMPLLRRCVARLPLPRGQAEDMVQEVAIAVLRRVDRFDPERGSFAHWLRLTARHAVLDALRRPGAACIRLSRLEARRYRASGRSFSELCRSLDDGPGGDAMRERLASQRRGPAETLASRDLLDELVAGVSPMEQRVLRLLFPRDGSAPLSLAAAGRILRLSESRISQLKQRALKKIRARVAS